MFGVGSAVGVIVPFAAEKIYSVTIVTFVYMESEKVMYLQFGCRFIPDEYLVISL